MKEEYNFCQRCGADLEFKPVEQRLRPSCVSCGWVVFQDPKVVVAALVVEGREVALVKRGPGVGEGKWSFPAGYVDRGETLQDAVVREAREEIGVEVYPMDLVGLYSRENDPIVLVIYEAKVMGGEITPQGEVLEAAWFPVDDLPPLAFSRDASIIAKWVDAHPEAGMQ